MNERVLHCAGLILYRMGNIDILCDVNLSGDAHAGYLKEEKRHI